MRYTTILRTQRALKALHNRDKTGHLHVSWDEVDNLQMALAELRAEIDADGNREERSARRAEAKERKSDWEIESEVFGDTSVRNLSPALPVAADFGDPTDDDIADLAQAFTAGDTSAELFVQLLAAAASTGDANATDIVSKLRAAGAEVAIPVPAGSTEDASQIEVDYVNAVESVED